MSGDSTQSGETTDRVMLDIETLGLEPGCAVLSIGAVRFDTDGVGNDEEPAFHRNISLKSCQDAGLSIDAGTLDWWLGQDEDVQHVLTGGDDLVGVLRAFETFYASADEIWAYSPSFDCEVLEAAYGAVGVEVPWSYRDERDCRTLASLPCAVELEQEGNEHDALDDARYQARVASKTLARLEDRQEVPDA